MVSPQELPNNAQNVSFKGVISELVDLGIFRAIDYAFAEFIYQQEDLLAEELKTRGHHVILVDYQPTSEMMVIDFAEKIKQRLPKNISLFSLRLQETETSFAEWFASDN